MTKHARARCVGAAVALILSLIACERSDRTVTAPSAPPNPSPPPSPPPPPSSGFSVTGSVVEFSATGERRLVPNLRLKVRTSSSVDGAVGGVELPDVVSDGSGRYEITDVTAEILFVSTAPESTHRLLCDFHPVFTRIGSQFARDLPVVPVSWSGDQLPRGMWTPGTSVHGTVTERVDGIIRPVAGATVTLDFGTQDPPATTNAAGFYMACSVVGTDQYRNLTARKDGYHTTTRQIVGGSDFRVDLELARQ